MQCSAIKFKTLQDTGGLAEYGEYCGTLRSMQRTQTIFKALVGLFACVEQFVAVQFYTFYSLVPETILMKFST
jgi:hypothetical protein